MNETIEVWPAGARPELEMRILEMVPFEDATVFAIHDLWLFGVRYLELAYAIRPALGPRERSTPR